MQIVLKISMFFIMFSMGLSIHKRDFIHLFKEPLALCLGIACQVIIPPLLAIGITNILPLKNEFAFGLILLAACPGGVYSNALVHVFNGSRVLSISLTAFSTILAFLVMPFWLQLGISFTSIKSLIGIGFGGVVLEVSTLTTIPLAIGLIFHNRFPVISKKLRNPFKIVILLWLAIVIITVFIREIDKLQYFADLIFPAVLILNVGGMLVGYLLAKTLLLSDKKGVTIAVEVGIQNVVLAFIIGTVTLENILFAIPAILYSSIMFITAGVLGIIYYRYLRNVTSTIANIFYA